MDITISYFMLVAVVMIALVGGFWIGRSVHFMMSETEDRISRDDATPGDGLVTTETSLNKSLPGEKSRDNKGRVETVEEMGEGIRQGIKRKNGERRIPLGWSIGSPVSGAVRSFCGSEGKGALVQPEVGKLYAPASGKITKLFPMGNQMQMRTDIGVELILRVGELKDDLHSMYYRSYVVQNEIVPKGKLLLEFDIEGLRGEGVDTTVFVTIASGGDYQGIRLTPRETVKTGEELLWLPPMDCDAFGIRRE